MDSVLDIRDIIRGYTYFNTVLLVCYVIPATIVIYSARFKMDKAFAVNIAVYFLSFLIKISICLIISANNEQ